MNVKVTEKKFPGGWLNGVIVKMDAKKLWMLTLIKHWMDYQLANAIMITMIN